MPEFFLEDIGDLKVCKNSILKENGNQMKINMKILNDRANKLYEICDPKSCGYVEKSELNILKSILPESVFCHMLDIFSITNCKNLTREKFVYEIKPLLLTNEKAIRKHRNHLKKNSSQFLPDISSVGLMSKDNFKRISLDDLSETSSTSSPATNNNESKTNVPIPNGLSQQSFIKKPLERLTIAVDDELTGDSIYSSKNWSTAGLAKIYSNDYDSMPINMQTSSKFSSGKLLYKSFSNGKRSKYFATAKKHSAEKYMDNISSPKMSKRALSQPDGLPYFTTTDMASWTSPSSGRSTPNSMGTNSQQTSPNSLPIPVSKTSFKTCYEEGNFFYYDATSGNIEKKNHHEFTKVMEECTAFGETDLSLAATTRECAEFRRSLCENSLADEMREANRKYKGTSDLDLRTPDRIFKVIFVGDSAVGKTCFLHRFCHNRFKPLFNATIGVDFTVKTIRVQERLVAVQLWDTAGQERFRSITKQYFRKSDGVVLMYDVTSEQSYLNVRNWIESVRIGVDDGCVMCLVGNKVDLYPNEECRAITYQDGKKLAEEFDMIFFETSAYTGLGINECMRALAFRLQQREEEHLEEALKLEMQMRHLKASWCCV